MPVALVRAEGPHGHCGFLVRAGQTDGDGLAPIACGNPLARIPDRVVLLEQADSVDEQEE